MSQSIFFADILGGRYHIGRFEVGPSVSNPNQTFGLVPDNQVFKDSFSCFFDMAYPIPPDEEVWGRHVPFSGSLIKREISRFVFDRNEEKPNLSGRLSLQVPSGE